MSTTGQNIIDAIISGKLLHATCAQESAHNCIVVWSSGAAEQVDAVVEAALAEAKADVARLKANTTGHESCWKTHDQLRARVAELDTDNCRLINKVDVQAVELHKLEADKARLDWLEDNGHHIHVSCWHASSAKENEWTIHDGDFDSEPIGADKLLRAAIDAAQKGRP